MLHYILHHFNLLRASNVIEKEVLQTLVNCYRGIADVTKVTNTLFFVFFFIQKKEKNDTNRCGGIHGGHSIILFFSKEKSERREKKVKLTVQPLGRRH